MKNIIVILIIATGAWFIYKAFDKKINGNDMPEESPRTVSFTREY